MMLGGHIVSSWQDMVTHVTMCNLTLTVKVVCALANGKPIVTPKYWADYITSLSTKQPVPDCRNYIPALAETTLNMNEVSFDVNENRKKLFAGKHFVFVCTQQYNAYSCMVTAAGGKADILEQNGMTYADLVQPNTIVMQYAFNKPSQETQVPQSFQEVTKYLKSRGKRVIPESEIGLAILHCSVDRHCNPDYRVASVLIPKGTRNISHPEVVLALDTQDSESESIKRIREAAKDTVIPESGTVLKLSGSVVTSTPKHVMNDRESMESKTVNVRIPGRTVEKERLPVHDKTDASYVSQKRFRSLEDDGFLRKKAAATAIEQSHVIIKLEPDAKNGSDDEDLFEFPSDKKARLAACEPANEDEDIFAFADDVKPKPLQLHAQKDQPVESSELPKKRKLQNGDTTFELNSFSKRRVLEKDVCHQQITESYKDEPMEHSVSPSGFLTVVQDTKENAALDKSIMNLPDGLKTMTVVEVEDLVSRNIAVIGPHAVEPRYVGTNFKKFRKVQAVNHWPVVRSEDLIPFEVDTKTLCKWLNETHNGTEMKNNGDKMEDNDDDWAFLGPSQTNKKKTQARHK
ncbi:hypothetical protein B7P43_G17632 [Cryptotermes secundus]|nr:hypothetical protein B7P43_G17632 [Cryptotermes secundus]PNF17488.1 hypothetical protein B7P43_G17632 [Cryptotermes secundus]